MPDWTKSMTRTFEYFVVDPKTWKDVKRIDTVKSCSISRDGETDTLGSASFELFGDIDECYVRVYMITIQDGKQERHPLGTFLCQTPSTSIEGVVRNTTVDAFTPLIELKENPPDLGYSILKGENIMDNAYRIVRENARAPVVKATSDETLYDDFVSNTEDTWMTFTKDLILNAKYEFGLDELSRIIFLPQQELESLQPVWTYTDDNSSILLSSMTVNYDLYDIPNVVEVICSTSTGIYSARVVNDDPNSPTSTVSRGRELKYRETKPSLSGDPTQSMVDEYAELLLKSLSTLQCTISYTHAYCPVRLGDCIRLNYTMAGLNNIKAKVISQSISCKPECTVSEKAVFPIKLWR